MNLHKFPCGMTIHLLKGHWPKHAQAAGSSSFLHTGRAWPATESQDQQHSTISSERQIPQPWPWSTSQTLHFNKAPRWLAKPWGPEAPSLEPAGKWSVWDAWAGGWLAGGGNEALPHLEHVVDDVELDDRLPPDQVVHHGVVDIVHHKEADDQNDTLQNVTHLGWLQQTPVPATEEVIKARVLLPRFSKCRIFTGRHR